MKFSEVGIVLLRGLGREKGHWGVFLEELQANLPGALLVGIDPKGVGQFRQESAPLSVRENVKFLRSQFLLNEVSQRPKRVVFGQSLGGMFAADWAALYPTDFQGAVLCNTSFAQLSQPWQRLKPLALKTLTVDYTKRKTPREREALVLDLVCESATVKAELLEPWSHLLDQAPVSIKNFAAQLLAASRFRGPRLAPPLPVLLLSALKDRMVDPQCMRALAARWDLPLTEHEWGGHDLMMDDPQWVSLKIKTFIEGSLS